ncbi:MAG TPA: zinc ribbon domain-containing protein, partial [Gemmatimonadales bacterium]|nr:zinc ribbon domain-containing protein [Gemmatimonadales bacterium]
AEQFLMGDLLYAPPAAHPEAPTEDEAPEPVDYTSESPLPPSIAPLPFAMDGTAPNQCPYCGGSLPAGRKVNFCPHCGQPPSGELKCPACGSEVDVGWAYCVSCGRATGFE